MRAVLTREDLIPAAMIFDGLFRAGTVLEAEAILRRVEEDLLPSQVFFRQVCNKHFAMPIHREGGKSSTCDSSQVTGFQRPISSVMAMHVWSGEL